jgi:deoxyribodipyrimidine photo-lyase
MSPPSLLHSKSIRLVWHRRDLRLHDNILYSNPEKNETIVGVYVFDDHDFLPRPSTCRPNEWDTTLIGPHAARILRESVQALRKSLRSIGGELLVRSGTPSTVIPKLVKEIGATRVYWNEEPGIYESTTSKAVYERLQHETPHASLHTFMQCTLYHPDDLPTDEQEWQQLAHPKQKRKFKKKQTKLPSPEPWPENLVNVTLERLEGIPRIMGDFRRAARTKTAPRPCLAAPTVLQTPETLASINKGDMPTLEELLRPLRQSCRPILGMPSSQIDRSISNALGRQQELGFQQEKTDPLILRGGEEQGLDHLQEFVEKYAATAVRNLACVSNNQSSRLSHYLAFGCLSPRRIVEEAQAIGDECSWLISHMTMRDFFLYTCLATGSQFYRLEGIPVSKTAAESIRWSLLDDEKVQSNFRRWALGDSGLPLIDAAMRELSETGYCSNRVRQNAASVLTKDLVIDWRAGAEWFQFLLQDHCVGANWGNWLYFSGVGPDPKQRHFRTVSQALRYDSQGAYVKKWIPHLALVQGDESFLRPWDFDTSWKKPLVDPKTQYTWHDLQRLEDKGKMVEDATIFEEQE